MAALKSMSRIAASAAILFGLNGLVNYSLMIPLQGNSAAFNTLRPHLDDGGFVLVFAVSAFLFWAMFALLPRERGFLYLGLLSFLSSLQMFGDWDGRALIFGALPSFPHGSLVIKCSFALVSLSFVAYLLHTAKNRITCTLLLT